MCVCFFLIRGLLKFIIKFIIKVALKHLVVCVCFLKIVFTFQNLRMVSILDKFH